MRPLQSRHRHRATGIASLFVLGLGLTALFLGFDWFWIVFAVGFAVVVPIVSILAGEDDPETAESPTPPSEPTTDDPLETLRQRYASGDLTEEQFERKLEVLLETETLESVAGRARRRGRTRTDDLDHDLETERETT